MFTVDTGVYILPYPLLLRFPMHCHKRRSCSTLHRYICPFSSETTTVRIGTKSFLHKPVPDVYKKYICTLIKPVILSAVGCVHVHLDVEKKSKSHREITCNGFHAVQRIVTKPKRFCKDHPCAANSWHIAFILQKPLTQARLHADHLIAIQIPAQRHILHSRMHPLAYAARKLPGQVLECEG